MSPILPSILSFNTHGFYNCLRYSIIGSTHVCYVFILFCNISCCKCNLKVTFYTKSTACYVKKVLFNLKDRSLFTSRGGAATLLGGLSKRNGMPTPPPNYQFKKSHTPQQKNFF